MTKLLMLKENFQKVRNGVPFQYNNDLEPPYDVERTNQASIVKFLFDVVEDLLDSQLSKGVLG